jgi:FMN phosphatase YigB (HAD superfamily)
MTDAKPGQDGQPPALVIFDAFDTLVTSRPGHKDTFLYGLARAGLAPSSSVIAELVAASEGLDHSAFSLSRNDYLEWTTETLRVVGRHAEVTAEYAPRVVPALEQLHQAPMMPFADTMSCLARLRAMGAIIAVCSNWGWDLLSDLKQASLAEDIDIAISSAQAGYRKQSPEIYRAVLGMAGVPADRAVFIGDNVRTDVLGPQSVGIRSILLARSQVRSHAGETIASLSELPPLLAAGGRPPFARPASQDTPG